MNTHLHRPRRNASLLCALVACAAAGWLPVAAGATPRPTGDVSERFFADPRADAAWHASGTWAWDPAATALVADGPGVGDFVRIGAAHFTGTLAARVNLPAAGDAAAPAARLVFAFDPSSGAHRWLEVRAGSPGRLTLGQTGAVGGSPEGVIQTWRTAVSAGAWHELSVRVGGAKDVAVALDGRQLFSAATAPLTAGAVGFGARGAGVAFDSFTFTAEPDGEPCGRCHAGQEPGAANVYTYWDGRWWDGTYGGGTANQQGGHGDPGGKRMAPASCNGATTCHGLRPRTYGTHPVVSVTCAGAYGCHDMRLPSPGEHRNGVREGRPMRGAQRSVNPYHLRAGFITASPRQPWSAQVAFDNYCASACHRLPSVNVRDDRHEKDTLPEAPNYRSVELGTHLTVSDAEAIDTFVDSDLTSRATTAEPDYVPCVACHDPHGTSARVNVPSASSTNRMLRKRAADPYFCSGPTGCHI